MNISPVPDGGEIKIYEYDQTSHGEVVLFLDPVWKKSRRIITLSREEVNRIRSFIVLG